MKYSDYPKYKESGTASLGEVPEHWEVKKLGYGAHLQGGYAFASDKFESEGVPVVRMNNLKRGVLDTADVNCLAPENCLDAFALGEGDLLFGMSGSIGKTGSLGNFARVCARDLPAQLNQRVGRFRVVGDSYSLHFLTYVIQTKLFYDQILLRATGTAQFNVSSEQVQSATVPFPPVLEQTAIAAFLDRKTGRIDTLVAKKRRLIGLLKEKRSALISRTVTRGIPAKAASEFGLKPHTRFKDSGIEWLGEVPEGWEVKSARLCYSIQLGKMLQPEASNSNDKEVPYLKSQHVQWESVRTDDLPTMWASTLDEVKYGVADGDLLVCEGGDVGRAGIVENPQPRTIIQNALHRVRSNKNDLRFLMFILEHAASQKWFEILCNRSTIAHFTGEKFGALRLPLPEISEQTAIAAFLDRETTKIDCLAKKVEAAIERLREYRTALITAAVTGKIDVREGGS